MSLFEPPPPRPGPPEPAELPEPDWAAPAHTILGGAIPLRLVLARTSEVAIAVIGGTAFPNGFELDLAIRLRRIGEEAFDDPLEFFHPGMWRFRRRMAETGELPPELFRSGLEFADGSKATALSSRPGWGTEQEPRGPVLIEHGGGGGGGLWDQTYWIWQLRAPGRLILAGEGNRADAT